MDTISGGSWKAEHLCILVHGLWGNCSHMNAIARALRAEYSADELYFLLAKKNSGSFTYDGIDRGGERLCAEIEDELRHIEAHGGKITKLSIIGYSLGGLVSRYAVGLLFAKGILDQIQCMNFTTFATPHLGVRSPLKGWTNHLWNVFGARALSESGRQLFIVDKFQDTERPLLSVLGDTDSIFMSGLHSFKRHTLYANIANDRSAVYYTTGISKTDPYRDLDSLDINFLKGWDRVILDPAKPFAVKPKTSGDAALSVYSAFNLTALKRLPILFIFTVLLPMFLANSFYQTIRSSTRIKTHEMGKAGLKIEDYRLPLWINAIRGEVEEAYGELSNEHEEEYLASEDDDGALKPEERETIQRERRLSMPSQPTLALAPVQFDMIESLDKLEWRKYPVWIQKDRHSHAAIIVRREKESFEEGHTVLKHFVQEEFLH